MARVLLSTGGNLGNRLANLRAVEREMSPQVRVIRASRVYETEPWGKHEQPKFLNQALEAETDLSPAELLGLCKQAEQNMGRVKGELNGPRTLDIDILFYGDEQLHTLNLDLPHPRMLGRAFVLRPLAELAPQLIHPQAGRSIAELAEETDPAHAWIYKGLEYGSRTFVMGILNITPDSFSGDGLGDGGDAREKALAQARAFVEAGADILDIGGESTRPGSRPITPAEEQQRILPVVKALAGETSAILSVDTSHASTAAKALEAGADWINDVRALRADGQLAAVCARSGCGLVLMHNRSDSANAETRDRLGGRYAAAQYQDLVGEVIADLRGSIGMALEAGCLRENLIVDPGIGFGKTTAQNLELLNRLDELRALKLPLLLGVSRKSFIGYTLDLPVDQRLEGSLAAGVLGISRGADILRVHDVRETVRAARLADAVLRAGAGA